MSVGISWAEAGWVPDFLVRLEIRRLCEKRLREVDIMEARELVRRHAEFLKTEPLSQNPDVANQQHYEVPAPFFEKVLGTHLKYSCCTWDDDVHSLNEAESRSLRQIQDRARLQDGQDILELGCGWGSLSLWMAKEFPKARITSVSNSASQREFIRKRAASLGLDNLLVLTADMNDFEPCQKYDRVVSIEMFEHMRNYSLLFKRISRWMRNDGKLFVHVFSHARVPYTFEVEGKDDWMGRYFFTGGQMPSSDLFDHFDDHLQVRNRWSLDGRHYQKTAEAWLRNLDSARSEVMPILRNTYGPEEAQKWFQRWRMFFLACSELFGFREGSEWGVTQCLFDKRQSKKLAVV